MVEIIQKKYLEKTGKKLSQRRLAALVGVSLPTIANWKEGASLPSPQNEKKLDQVLNDIIEGKIE